jgi:hypothetical protein
MTRIIIKHNSTSGVAPAPAELSVAELAVNTGDGSLYTKLSDGTVSLVGGGGSGAADGGTYSDNIVTPADCSTLPICGLVDGGNF